MSGFCLLCILERVSLLDVWLLSTCVSWSGSAFQTTAGFCLARRFTTRPATVMRQRLRQEPLRTVAADEEEPSARAAAAEGRSSSRARSQFHRMRTVLPPESPLAVALPRSGHSTNVDTSASQQVYSTLSLDCKNWSLLAILRDKYNFMINLTR